MIEEQLVALNAAPIVIQAARQGFIPRLRCEMPKCLLELEREDGREVFEPRQGRYPKWAPSPDRFPVPGHEDGSYTPDNIRLSHKHCNCVAGGLLRGPDNLNRLNADPEFQKRNVARLKAQWADPEWRSKFDAIQSRPETVAKKRAALAQINNDPVRLAHRIAKCKEVQSGEEWQAGHRARLDALHANLDFQSRKTAWFAKLNASPEGRAHLAHIFDDPVAQEARLNALAHGRCTRWNINRGKPHADYCDGQHLTRSYPRSTL